MGFSILYRSCEPMHPVTAFEIRRHADELIRPFRWISCEPVKLCHRSDGHLCGESEPNYGTQDPDTRDALLEGMLDGNVMTMVEVLCELSRRHEVDWDLSHDQLQGSIGMICDGVADQEMLDEIMLLDSIGGPLDEWEEDGAFGDSAWSRRAPTKSRSYRGGGDSEGPRLLKFPTEKR